MTLIIAGCGAVNVYFGGGQDAGYYYIEDSRHDNQWYYSDGSRWMHWDDYDGWAVDADFVWYDDHDDWYYYEYDPLYYDPWYDPYDYVYYDDPYYWDDVYWGDGGYYGDDWYWEDEYYDPYYNPYDGY